MIQINLLPDIKRQYLRSQRVRNFFLLGAMAASGGSVLLVVAVWLFTVSQNVHLGNLQDDIDSGLSELQAVEDLDKVVTIQNQLSAVEPLNDQKPEAARLFTYLSQLTPNEVNLGAVEVEYVNNAMEITGLGDGFKEINRFVDAIKNAQYTTTDIIEPVPAFSGVTLASSGSSDEAGSTSFKITMLFDPLIFDNNVEGLELSIPRITSTQSEVERPKSLFDPAAQQEPQEEGEEQ